MTSIRETKYKKFKALIIENEKVFLVTIPELGGKIISLKNKTSNFEFAFNKGPKRLSKIDYNSDYSLSSSYGIDECFPTIAPCIYPEDPWRGERMPDHGEIWTLGFESAVKDSYITQKVYGKRFPYIFYRDISLDNNKVIFLYKVMNTGNNEFKYIWSFHPHFNLYKNTEIKIKDKANFYIDYSKNNRFQLKTKKYSWPFAAGKNNDSTNFSKISELDGNAEKLFLVDLQTREIKLIYHDYKEAVGFSFRGNKINHCGLWINRGGWPLSGEPYNTIAIEPCNCITDKFEDSLKKNIFDSIGPRHKNNWEVTIEINC